MGSVLRHHFFNAPSLALFLSLVLTVLQARCDVTKVERKNNSWRGGATVAGPGPSKTESPNERAVMTQHAA